MYKRVVNTVRILNLLFQSIYSLVFPIGVGALIAYLTTSYLSWPRVMWALFLTVGTMIGLYSMVKFILIATRQMENLRKAQEAEAEKKAADIERRERLIAELKKEEREENS